MMASPFTFYRGAAKIMAADLQDTPKAGLPVQPCGDVPNGYEIGFAREVLFFEERTVLRVEVANAVREADRR
jgi:hypothetical protein